MPFSSNAPRETGSIFFFAGLEHSAFQLGTFILEFLQKMPCPDELDRQHAETGKDHQPAGSGDYQHYDSAQEQRASDDEDCYSTRVAKSFGLHVR